MPYPEFWDLLLYLPKKRVQRTIVMGGDNTSQALDIWGVWLCKEFSHIFYFSLCQINLRGYGFWPHFSKIIRSTIVKATIRSQLISLLKQWNVHNRLLIHFHSKQKFSWLQKCRKHKRIFLHNNDITRTESKAKWYLNLCSPVSFWFLASISLNADTWKLERCPKAFQDLKSNNFWFFFSFFLP